MNLNVFCSSQEGDFIHKTKHDTSLRNHIQQNNCDLNFRLEKSKAKRTLQITTQSMTKVGIWTRSSESDSLKSMVCKAGPSCNSWVMLSSYLLEPRTRWAVPSRSAPSSVDFDIWFSYNWEDLISIFFETRQASNS